MDGEYDPGEGTLAIIVPSDLREGIVEALAGNPGLAQYVKVSSADLMRIGALSAIEAKGLGYDTVVLVESSRVLAGGLDNLYIAMTRPTRRLNAFYSGELPAGMA